MLLKLRIRDIAMNNKRTRKASKNQPESFSLVVNVGEALVYKNSTITPNCSPYLVTGTTIALTRDVLQEWFVNNIVPLVGQDAANENEEPPCRQAESSRLRLPRRGHAAPAATQVVHPAW